MSKSRATVRNSASKLNHIETLASTLYGLANKLTLSRDDTSENKWLHALSDLTLNCLTEGKDKAIALALEMAEEVGDTDSTAALNFMAELESSSHTVPRQDVAEALTRTLEGPLDAFVTCHLFAIPIISRDFSCLKTGEMPRSVEFNELVRSIRADGIVGQGSSVILENYLYHPTELDNLRWSDIFNLLGRIIKSQTRVIPPQSTNPQPRFKGTNGMATKYGYNCLKGP